MSDIFEQKRRQEQIFNTDPRIAAEAATRINRQEAEFQQNLNGQIQEYLRLSTLKENKYFAPLSDEDLIVLETAQEAGVMTEDEAYKQATSIALAKRYNMNQAYVRQNLEAFLAAEDIDTTKKVPRTVFNGFVARARTGINSLNMGRFGSRLIEMDASGNTDTAESIRTYLRALQQENEALEFGDESLAKNGVLRFLQKEVVGGTLESLPYTMYIMGASAIGSLFAGTAGARAAGFAAGWELVAGQEYFALTELKDENGNQLIDNDLARNVSLVVGAISSFIETAVWDSFSHFGRAVGKVTGKEAANSMTQRIVGKVLTNLHAKGFLYRLAKEGMEGLFRMAGEGGEEFFQQISEEVGTNLALEFQKERVLEKMGAALEERDRLIQQLTDAKTSTGDIFHNAFEALKGGAASSLLMGLPETVMNYHGSGKDARLLRAEAAVTPSEEAFVKKVENLSLWDGMNPEGKDRAIREYYKNRRTGVEADEARLAEELKHTKGLGEGYAQPETNPETGEEIPLGKAFKEKSGAYYSQLDEDTGIYKVGDRRMKTRTNLWADIQFHKDGGKVVVDSFHVRSDLDTPQFRREVFGQFAEHYAGKDITWEPGPGAVAENAVRDDLIQHNPLGEQAGLNYFSAEDAGDMDAARYRNRVVDTLARNFPASTSEEHAVMAAAWEAAAADRGLSLEAYVNQEFGSLEEAFTTEPNADIDAAAKEGKQVKGAVFFKNLARDAKATIYVTKKADLSTFIHEMAHVYRRRLDGELLAEAEGIWGKFDRKAEEQFAEDYEAWWREGKAPRPEMESFFRKFSEFLKKIYNAVSKRGPVSEEVRAFFEKLHANDAAAAETGAAETGAESAGEGAAGTDPAAAGERHEANRKLVEDRESFDKNNTGEAPKPVHENIGYLEKKLAAVNENTPAKEKYRIQASAARELQLKALDSLPDMRRVVSGIVDTINQKYGEGTVRFIERKATDENPKPVKDVAGIIRKLNNGDKINQILDVMGITIVTRDVATL
ncbi:MAG: hypothetical protein LBG42_04985, partial [Treponema sp.]|nr:hypothetical protein [Treponema sp.]